MEPFSFFRAWEAATSATTEQSPYLSVIFARSHLFRTSTTAFPRPLIYTKSMEYPVGTMGIVTIFCSRQDQLRQRLNVYIGRSNVEGETRINVPDLAQILDIT